MIEILTDIPTYCYSNAFPILEISFDSPRLKFELINNITNQVVIAEHYDKPPIGQNLDILLSEIFNLDLDSNVPDFSKLVSPHLEILKEYKIVLSADENTNVVTNPFKVLFGFVYQQKIVDSKFFMHSNVLTIRPERSYIYDFEPVCLSFFPEELAHVFVDILFIDGSITTIDYAPLIPQLVQSVNVSYGHVQRLVNKPIASYKVYAKVLDELVTNKIELILLPFNHLRESYIYANRLGGWDSISFSGEQIEVNTINPSTANFRDIMLQYDSEILRVKQKNTGFIYSVDHHRQIIDFFRSSNKYVVEEGVLKPIVIRQLDPEYNKAQMNSFNFEYSYASKHDRFMPIDTSKPFISI